METKYFEVFNEKQLEVIKDIAKFDPWGDTDMEFNSDKCSYAYGFFTNKVPSKYKGKEFSGICSGISKTIKSTGNQAITICNDYWGDGSGDMMFFNFDLLGITDVNELIKWATEK